MRPPTLRLTLQAVFWRLALVIFLIAEWYHWHHVGRVLRVRQPVLKIQYWALRTPYLVFLSLFLAGLLTLAAALVVRWGVRPWLAKWLDPPRLPEDSGNSYIFHLHPTEEVIAESPARWDTGQAWLAGKLVLTSQRIWFAPSAWDADLWSLPLEEVRSLRATPAPGLARGFIVGLPDQVEIVGGPGVLETFAVPEPARVLTWLESSEPAHDLQPA